MDNAVFSAIFNNLMLTTKHLFHMVVEIRVLAFKIKVVLKPFHTSGDHIMIALGIDGLSRGYKYAGILLGWDMRALIQ